MKIQKLQLYNFKFFTDTNNELNFGGKHMLIWGENGSGKSSIYWAIYTLLQCSFKDRAGIDAYFTYGDPKNLRNIYARKNARSFIKMTLDNNKKYKIASGDYSVIGNQDLELSAISTDFLDYNAVGEFLRFWHKSIPDQFPLFEEQLFRFMPFTSPAPYTFSYFDKAWEAVWDGLDKDPKTKKYPSAGSTTFVQYNSLANEFNRQLRENLGLMNVKANELLQTKFKYPIEVELQYTPFEFTLNRPRTDIQYKEPTIVLTVNDYYGKGKVVNRPQSFLNEAKKTAIGLALRLALLERRLLADKLNVLALDDLLISLDMSNREVVLKLLLEDYQDKYQLLIFTHDKSFFNLCKQRITLASYHNNWLFKEMYVEQAGRVIKPFILNSAEAFDRAAKHLKRFDYPACANALRQGFENLVFNFLPENDRRTSKDDEIVHKTFGELLSAFRAILVRYNQNIALVNDLFVYKDHLMNPLSHDDDKAPVFREELERIFKLIPIVKGLSNEVIKEVAANPTIIRFVETDNAGQLNTYRISLREHLRKYVLLDGQIHLSRAECTVIDLTKPDGTVVNLNNQYDSLRVCANRLAQIMGKAAYANDTEILSKLDLR